MEMATESDGGKTTKRSRVLHDRRRVARREQEAERWAQARLQGFEQNAMPTNTTGLKYLYVHYPELLSPSGGHNSKKHQQLPQIPAADMRNTIPRQGIHSDTELKSGWKKLEDLVSREQERSSTQRASKSHFSDLLHRDHKIDATKEDASSSAAQIWTVDSFKSPSTTKPINSFQHSSANAFAFKTQPTNFLRIATPKPPSLQRVNASGPQKHVLSPTATDGFIHESYEVSGDSCGALSKGTDSEHKNSAVPPRSERLKVSTTAANQRVGRPPEDRDDQSGSSSVFYKTHTQEAVKQNTKAQIAAVGLFQNSQPQYLSGANMNSSACCDSVVSRPEGLEADFMHINKPTPRVVLPPIQQDGRRTSKRTDISAVITHRGSCSVHNQSLRATAPVFVPKTSAIHSGTGAGQFHLHSPLVVPSLTDTTGSQLHDMISRPTTISSSTTNSNAVPFLCPSGSVSVFGNLSNNTANQESPNSECQCLVKFPAYYRLISNGPIAPVNVQPSFGNMEYMSSPYNDDIHTARSLFALEISRRATGLTAEELLSFLAIEVPCANQVTSFPQVMRGIHKKSDILQKCHFSRYFTPLTQRLHFLDCPYNLLITTMNGENVARKSDTVTANKQKKTELECNMEKKLSWQAEDFQGYRVIPKELRLADEGYDISSLAAEARISLCRPGTEAHTRKGQKEFHANGTEYKENPVKQIFNVDEGLIRIPKAQNNETGLPLGKTDPEDSTEARELDTCNSDVNTNQASLRDYKELAEMSDIDSLASENGEHEGNEFFVTKKANDTKGKQLEKDDLRKGVVTTSSPHLQPVRHFEPFPSEAYQEYIYSPHQSSAVRQEQYSHFLVPGEPPFVPQMQPMQFPPNFCPQLQYQYPQQFPPHHHWQVQRQHDSPTDSYYLSNPPVSAKYLMTRQDMDDLRRRYPNQFWQ